MNWMNHPTVCVSSTTEMWQCGCSRCCNIDGNGAWRWFWGLCVVVVQRDGKNKAANDNLCCPILKHWDCRVDFSARMSRKGLGMATLISLCDWLYINMDELPTTMLKWTLSVGCHLACSTWFGARVCTVESDGGMTPLAFPLPDGDLRVAVNYDVTPRLYIVKTTCQKNEYLDVW